MMRSFYQFLDRRKYAPRQTLTNDPTTVEMYEKYPGQFQQKVIASGEPFDPNWYATSGGVGPKESTTMYGDPGYNYLASGYPELGKTIGEPSQYWNALLHPQAAAARKPAAPAHDPLAAALMAQGAPAPAAARPNTDATLAMSLDEQMRRAMAAQGLGVAA
jgi:hypothetical protein